MPATVAVQFSQFPTRTIRAECWPGNAKRLAVYQMQALMSRLPRLARQHLCRLPRSNDRRAAWRAPIRRELVLAGWLKRRLIVLAQSSRRSPCRFANRWAKTSTSPQERPQTATARQPARHTAPTRFFAAAREQLLPRAMPRARTATANAAAPSQVARQRFLKSTPRRAREGS